MKKAFLFLIFNLIFFSCFAQYRIKTIDENEHKERPSSTLTRNEILLVCLVNPKYTVQCSVDRTLWRNQNISYQSAIEITLEDEFAYFFVSVCDIQSPNNCKKFRLKPGRRYVLRRDLNTNKVVIKGEIQD